MVDSETLLNRYEFFVGTPLQDMLMKGLEIDEETVIRDHLRSLVERGVERRYSARVDYQTNNVFKEYVANHREELFQLAKRRPVEFDLKLSAMKANSDCVADKLLFAMNKGKPILSTVGNEFDLFRKQGIIRGVFWKRLYDELTASLAALPQSDCVDWSRIVLLFKKRQLDDEGMCMPVWRNKCPFGTNFEIAFRKCSYAMAMNIYGSAL